MGYYINPPTRTKEEWLEENGEKIPQPMTFSPPKGMAYVCLILNPSFTAAGIVFDEREFEVFTHPSDLRPKRWFLMLTEDVIEMCPLVASRLS